MKDLFVFADNRSFIVIFIILLILLLIFGKVISEAFSNLISSNLNIVASPSLVNYWPIFVPWTYDIKFFLK